jgi:DNA polymerase III subunit gamma/tau
LPEKQILEEEKPISLTVKKEIEKVISTTKVSLKINNGLSFSDSISINTNNLNKEEKKVDVSENITNRPTEDYSLEKFATVWNDFKIQLQQKGKSSLAMVFEEVPEIKDNLIILTVGNKALEDEFKAQQSDFLEFVRKELSNFDIQITTEINKDVSAQKAYTPEEKFVKMSEKNPTLKKLVSKLDMDIGYA